MAKQKRPRVQPDQLRKYIVEGDARVASIMAGAVVNDLLRIVVQYNMIELSGKEEEEIFENNGTLATFSALIRVGHAMGLYSRKLRDDMNAIRKIRNDFAHTLEAIDLSQSEYRSRLLGLNALKDEPDRSTLPEGELLFKAMNKIIHYLMLLTAPSNLRADEKNRKMLKSLDFSNFKEVKKRDVHVDRRPEAKKSK